MRKVCYVIFGACLSMLHVAYATEFGVGFGLGLDYGYPHNYHMLDT
jgi:hypothetical protein